MKLEQSTCSSLKEIAHLQTIEHSLKSLTMDAFLANLATSVEQSIMVALSAKLNDFAAHIVELPEMKEKGVTAAQVLDCWNSLSDFKVTVGAVAAPVAGVAAAGAATPADRKPRAQTDKNRKCGVLKTRGDHKGEPCGKYCVVGFDFCSEHLKKNQKSPDTKAVPAAAVGVNQQAGEVKTVQAPTAQAAAPVVAVEKPAAGAKCEHILESGKNKGDACGKNATKKTSDGNWCTTHGKKH